MSLNHASFELHFPRTSDRFCRIVISVRFPSQRRIATQHHHADERRSGLGRRWLQWQRRNHHASPRRNGIQRRYLQSLLRRGTAVLSDARILLDGTLPVSLRNPRRPHRRNASREYTVAEMLGSKGYRTGFFGKWHIGWVRMEDGGSRGFFSPPGQHGFEEWFATTSAVPTFDPGITPKGWSKWGNKKGEPWKGGTPYVHNGEPYQGDITGDDSRIIMDKTIKSVSYTHLTLPTNREV